MKLMHIGRRSLNNFMLLHRCRDAQESMYHLLQGFSIGVDSFTIMAFATGPGVNGSGLESSSYWLVT